MNAYKFLLCPLITLVAMLALAAAEPASAQTGCANSGKPIRSITTQNARDALKCLLNVERSAKDLRRNADLESAAQRHAGTMASQKCVSHQCRNEPNLLKRVARTGYLRRSSNWGLGEVIIAAGANKTPRQIVSAWMNSRGHRDNIKSRSHDDVGIGLSLRDGTFYIAADLGHH